MSARRPITPEIISRAQELRSRGMGWCKISARLGVSEDALRRRLDERYAARRNDRVRAWRSTAVGKIEPVYFASTLPDTRSRLARFFGDPPPGRSALDQKKAAQVIPTNIHNPHNAPISLGSPVDQGREALQTII